MKKVLKWYCKRCNQFKSVFETNDLNNKICHECGEKLIVKEVSI